MNNTIDNPGRGPTTAGGNKRANHMRYSSNQPVGATSGVDMGSTAKVGSYWNMNISDLYKQY